jgi:hypothetical protein
LSHREMVDRSQAMPDRDPRQPAGPAPLVLTMTGCLPSVLVPDGEGGFRGIAGYRRPDPPDHRTPIAIVAPAE